MKKKVLAFFCLFMVMISFSIPAAGAKSSLFNFDFKTIDTIKITMGESNGANTLNAAQNPDLIEKVIRSFNEFEYGKSIEIDDRLGWYASLTITEKDGTQYEIDIGESSVIVENGEKTIAYVSAYDDYFGDGWLNLLFPYSFTDVKMWWDTSIKTVYDNGLMHGTSETTFSPDAVMTRGMFVTVLGRMANITEADYQENIFEDVEKSDYSFPYVSWAVQSGIVNGASERLFFPNTPVSREQAVVMLVRFSEAVNLEYPTTTNPFKPNFVDIENTSQEFKEKLQVVHAASIFPPLQDTDNNIFDPTGTMTRAETAEIFENVYHTLYEW